MLEDLSPLKLLIIVAVLLLLFGGKKIPELMHGLGKGLNEFKRATQGGDDPNAVKTPEAPKA
ncbi:MAG TPA: twin-arginine translocase TatA/TatE family subunit [Candidatus Kapabacteria bacterium]|jgi:sec-independent protein translocase protein TatA